MGHGTYSTKDWNHFSTKRKYRDPKTTTAHIYRNRGLHEDLDPKNFKIRESVDSVDNPESRPIIIGLDVTGSMSPVLDSIARKGLKTVCEQIYERKSIKDPHICILGIGDVECDRAPFQATQFEADIRIFKDLEKLYLEGGGGGNDHESYILAWYFAKFRTKTDSFPKRGKKGYIFTIGDEEITPEIRNDHFKTHLGDMQSRRYSPEELFDLVYPEWRVYHIIIAQGDHASRNLAIVEKSWKNVIGAQRTITLDDHEKLGEIIVSILELNAGKSLKDTAASWDGTTSIVINDALKSLALSPDAQKSGSIDKYL